MSSLVRAYESPSYDFDPERVEELRDAFGARADQLQQSGAVDQVLGTLDGAVSQAQQEPETSERRTAASSRLLGFEGDGFIRATRICDGWGEEPTPDDEANGHIQLIAGFTEGGLDPTVWGTMEDCRYKVGATRILLTEADADRPALSLHLEAEDASELASSEVLFQLNLRGRIDEDDTTLKFDFRLLPESGRLEYRVPIDGASVIVVTEGAVPVALRARNGTFRCSSDFRCTSGDGDAGVPAE